MNENKRKKIYLGQFFTKEKSWLKPQIIDFILSSKCSIAYDPFAGNGDILNCMKDIGISEHIGLDIDKTLEWQWNDSLKKNSFYRKCYSYHKSSLYFKLFCITQKKYY